MMGSLSGEEGRYDNEDPQHQVTLSPYLISKTEVTQAVWQSVMASNPSYFKEADRPVEQVSWNDCMKFCEKTGLALPTEAQWEFACRAGTQSVYYFGNKSSSLLDYAWYGAWSGGNSGKQTHQIAKKQPNAYGLYDTAGNVWEWCSDWYAEYPNGSVTNPVGPGNGTCRVMRGGSWYQGALCCRSAYRGIMAPGDRDRILGLRVCLSIATDPGK